MNRYKAQLLFAVCAVLVACATRTAAPTAVNLKISSDTASKSFIADVRSATLDAIRTLAPNARPMTVAVDLEIARHFNSSPAITPTAVNEQRALPPPNSTPLTEGAIATVPVHNSPFGTSAGTEDFTDFRVSYTITDAQGRIIESNRLRLDNGYLLNEAAGTPVNGSGKTNVFSAYRQLVGNTAHFLAARVKTLS